MASVEDSPAISTPSRFPLPRESFYSPPLAVMQRGAARSMRTVRTNFYQEHSSFTSLPDFCSENLTESVIDMRLGQLTAQSDSSRSSGTEEESLDVSRTFSDSSTCSSDVSGELQRLVELQGDEKSVAETAPFLDFLLRDNLEEVIENISPENLRSAVKICIDGLRSPSLDVKRSAAAKLRFLAKNHSDNRALIGESGAIPALISLLRCCDPLTQEHAVTALLNLSLHDGNRCMITGSGTIKSLVYVLRTGTEVSKENTACALLRLALVEENRISIGACGAIPPLVSLLIYGSTRGKKDALTTLYKLCSVKPNKERAITAGAVKPLIEMVVEQRKGMAEKALVVMNSLAEIAVGRDAIVEGGGIAILVEAIEDGCANGREFAVLTLLQLCTENVMYRSLLVREGGIPPLVSLSQSGSISAKHKAETLLRYLRESRPHA